MEHTIVVWKKLKERNEKGKYGFGIVSRYTLSEEDVCQNETDKYNALEDIDENDKYEYYAEIEETKH